MGSLRRATVLLMLVLAGLPASAAGAPSCAEGPQTIGSTIVGTPCDDTIRAIIVTGAGRAFCAGADVWRNLPDRGDDAHHVLVLDIGGGRVLNAHCENERR